MKKYLKYAVVAVSLAAVVAPALALGAYLPQPTVPVGSTGQAVTASTLERLIQQIVQFMITVSVVIAVGAIIWGGLKFVTNKPDEGKKILLNGAIGIVIILGVGLILNTIARFVNTGGSLY